MTSLAAHNPRASRATDPAVAGALAHCAQVARARARNFYYGLRLAPEPKRSAVYAVYAWMRRADDEADGAGEVRTKLDAMRRFREASERIIGDGRFTDDERRDPVWLAIDHTVRAFSLDPADFRALLDGVEQDLLHEAAAAERRASGDTSPAFCCATRDELRDYCYRVASTVGLICVRIWGLREGADAARARELSIRRGLAFQLTNILRDVREDAADGRVYLPREDFVRAGLTPEQLCAWTPGARCAQLVRTWTDWAALEYRESAPLDDMIDPACAPALRAMTAIYRGLLEVIERRPSRLAGAARVRLSSVRKAMIALGAVAQSRGATRNHAG